MKTTNFERLFVVVVSFILNKLLLFWLIGSSSFSLSLMTFILLVLNFMILANSVDKAISSYAKGKQRKQNLVLKR